MDAEGHPCGISVEDGLTLSAVFRRMLNAAISLALRK